MPSAQLWLEIFVSVLRVVRQMFQPSAGVQIDRQSCTFNSPLIGWGAIIGTSFIVIYDKIEISAFTP